ncbi:MAG TPA: elongation factor 1-beta [Thermoplasmata archaeon]
MGEVAIQYRVLPVGLDVDLAKLRTDIEKALPKAASLKAHEEKALAFGLKALHVLVVLDDKLGGSDQVEGAISSVAGVQSVEMVEMGLL